MRVLFYLLVGILFSGCFSSYPMSLSQKEYEALSLQQKVELRQKQEKLDTKLSIEREKTRRAKQKQKHELALKEQESLKQLYKNSKSKVIVFLNGKFHNNKEFLIPPFEIQKYEVKKVQIYDKNARYVKSEFFVSYQESGLYLGVNPKNRNLNSYVSYNNKHFYKNLNRYKPFVIPYSYTWYKTKEYQGSFKSNYKLLKNVRVRVILKNRY